MYFSFKRFLFLNLFFSIQQKKYLVVINLITPVNAKPKETANIEYCISGFKNQTNNLL